MSIRKEQPVHIFPTTIDSRPRWLVCLLRTPPIHYELTYRARIVPCELFFSFSSLTHACTLDSSVTALDLKLMDGMEWNRWVTTSLACLRIRNWKTACVYFRYFFPTHVAVLYSLKNSDGNAISVGGWGGGTRTVQAKGGCGEGKGK